MTTIQPPAHSGLWETPAYFFDALNRVFGFNLDVCASDENAKCERYFDEADNDGGALVVPWTVDGEPARCFMNPPFAEGEAWTRKARDEVTHGNARLVVGVVLNSTDTLWWHENVMAWAARVYLLCGRIPFEYRGHAFEQNRYSNAVVVWYDGRFGPPEFRSTDARRPRF